MTSQLEETKALDFLGNVIEAGALIVYPSMVGRSPRLTLAEIISVKETPGTSYKHSIKVQPLADSDGGYRFKEFVYDHEKGTGKYSDRPAKPVTLHFADRIMVIE